MEDLKITIQAFIDYWTSLPIIRAAVILAGSFLCAFLINFVFTRQILNLTKKTSSTKDDDIVTHLRTPIFWSVIFVGLWLAIGEFSWDPKITFYLFSTLKSIAAFLWGRAFIKIGETVLDFISDIKDKLTFIQPSTLPLFSILLKVFTFGIMIYVIFLSWNIDVTAWLASAGIVGIAVGFGAKDTLANLFAGLFILTDAPYKVGDFIVLDDGQRGMVTKIGIRSTRLLTRDDIEITIPNSVIANTSIVNETSGPYDKRRLRLNIGVAYGSDIDEVKAIVAESINDIKHISPSPSPRVHFTEMGDSSLVLQVKVWIDKPVYKGRVTDMLNSRIYKALNTAGIEIPFPQRDLHIRNIPDALIEKDNR